MIRDPSDGSVKEKPEAAPKCGCDACKDYPHRSDCAVHNAPALPIGPCNCRIDSGLPIASANPENVARLEKSREQLKRYHETGVWNDLVRGDNESELPSES